MRPSSLLHNEKNLQYVRLILEPVDDKLILPCVVDADKASTVSLKMKGHTFIFFIEIPQARFHS